MDKKRGGFQKVNTPIFGKADTKKTVKKTQQELGKLKDLLEEDLKRLRPGQNNAKKQKAYLEKVLPNSL